jgi:hypothetical protein
VGEVVGADGVLERVGVGVNVAVAVVLGVALCEPVAETVADVDAVVDAVALLERVTEPVRDDVGVCVGVAVPVDEPELVTDELMVDDGVVERLGDKLEVGERERLAVAVVDAVADAEHDAPGATMAANVGRENSLCAYA